MNTRNRLGPPLVALLVLGCARATPVTRQSTDGLAAPRAPACGFDTELAGLAALMTKRGCSPTVTKAFVGSFREASIRTWDVQRAMRRIDLYGKRYGGRMIRSVLRLSMEPSGRVTAVALDEASGATDLDEHAVTAFAVGVPLTPLPACGSEGTDLVFTLGLCLEVRPAPAASP